MLSSWGVAFAAINTEAQPEAMQALQRFGISRVPAVVVDDRAVHGWNPQGLAELVGVPYAEAERLSPEELAARLDSILAAAQRAVRQIPAASLQMKTPGRDRTVQQLAYHIFRVALSYREALEQGYLPAAWFEEKPPAGMADGPALADYGQRVRAALAAWWQRRDACAGEVDTYYGPQTAHAFLERTVWHAAQHLRQLYTLLEHMGVTPEEPLAEADWQGLPLPREVW